jgi:hypothetical protein
MSNPLKKKKKTRNLLDKSFSRKLRRVFFKIAFFERYYYKNTKESNKNILKDSNY